VVGRAQAQDSTQQRPARKMLACRENVTVVVAVSSSEPKRLDARPCPAPACCPALPCLLHSICVHAISMHDGSKPTALAVRHTRQCPGACLGARACTEACCCVVRWTEVDKKKKTKQSLTRYVRPCRRTLCLPSASE
jgi:hypothetical protein